MSKQLSVRTLSIVAIAVFIALPATAQATRTWVSGVGDDANPCSRTAPCKTFAGAISKTAAGGAISVLDPGGFGAVTITKSITIETDGVLASILASGTNGIIINALATDRVILRNLTIEGVGTGLNGIRFIGGGSLFVDGCHINNFTQKGISFEPTAAGTHRFAITNTIIRNNATATGGGILVKPGAAASVVGIVENVSLQKNLFGLRLEDRSKVTAVNSIATQNTNAGFVAESVGGGEVSLSLERCTATGNAAGIKPLGATAAIRISNCTSTQNGIGLDNAGAQLISFGNNHVAGNVNDGVTPTPIFPK